jgi:hypothetical protein
MKRFRHRRATYNIARFEHRDRVTPTGEVPGADKPVMTRADNQNVGV